MAESERDSKPLDIDTILSIIENPIRRKILEYLSKEPHYPLQLAKKIGVSQQAIVKHLKIMEDAGIVESIFEEGWDHKGPPRRYYVPKRRFTLIMDVGKNMFRTELKTYTNEDITLDLKTENNVGYNLVDKVKDIKNLSSEKKISVIGKLLKDVEGRLEEIENERERLIIIRDQLLSEAHDAILDIYGDYNRRLVLYYVLEDGIREIEVLAEELNLREKIIRQIMKDLENMLRYY